MTVTVTTSPGRGGGSWGVKWTRRLSRARPDMRWVAAALRPGGWLILGHGKLGGTAAEDAVTRLKTLAYGGTALDEAAACHLLRSAGLTSVRSMPTPAGAPAIAIGQKPA